MNKRPWMPLYVADYLKDTTHLGALESGAYLHLIMNYWQNGGLPSDDRQLARIAKLTMREWRKSRATLAAFFQDGWKHKRVEAELAHTADIAAKRRAAAEEKHRLRREKAAANAHANAPTLHTSHITEQADARAPELAKAIVRAFERACSLTIPDTSRVSLWLTQGYEPRIILATIEERLAHKRSISGLKYFDGAIREAHVGQAPKIARASQPNYDAAVIGYKATGNWPAWAPGSEPGMAGCMVPPEILRKHGYLPGVGSRETPLSAKLDQPNAPKASLDKAGPGAQPVPVSQPEITDHPKAALMRKVIRDKFAKANRAPPDTAILDRWLAQGIDPRIIMSVVAQGLEGRPDSHLSDFDEEIQAMHELDQLTKAA